MKGLMGRISLKFLYDRKTLNPRKNIEPMTRMVMIDVNMNL